MNSRIESVYCRYVDQYKENQTVKIIQAVLSDNDGTVPFAVSEDLVSMEGHVIPPGQEGARAVRHHANTVPSMTVKTFTRKHNVPTNFGLLSVDAEGMSNKVGLVEETLAASQAKGPGFESHYEQEFFIF